MLGDEGESAFVSTTGSVPDQSVTSDQSSPRSIVFIAGERSCVEKAVHIARELYRNRRVVFICEPRHSAWLSQSLDESVFVVDQPFNPFGRIASVLLKKLQAQPVEDCAIVVADLGFESFRFRVFALRLRPSRFLLLQTGGPTLPQPMGRILFTLLAGMTLFLRIILKIPGLDAFQKSVRAGQGILALLARLLAPLDQPLAVGCARVARLLSWFRSYRIVNRGNEIVHVVPHIGMGGVQRQLVLLLKNRSPAYNHRVVVFFSGDRFFAPELDECGVPVYYLDSEAVRASLASSPGRRRMQAVPESLFSTIKTSLPFCREITKLMLFLRTLQPRPDIVHCWLLFANLAGSIAARLAGVPRVVTSVRNIQSWVNYNYYDPRWQRAIERATVPLANIITANAPAVAVDYRMFTGARAEKIVTVPNGVDVEAFRLLTPQERVEKRRTLGAAPTDLVVGTVARLAKEKDFGTFLRAVALAREKLPSLRCFIVGEGPLRTHLESCASSLRLAGVVQFLGERKDIGDLVQCYDVYLLTSLIEGMPNAVMESQLLGVPVVATRAGGTVDIIRDGETGLLAPIGDYQALASCIVRLFTEDGLWGRISLAAKKQISEGYTIEQLVARTETVYRDLLDRNAESVTAPCAE
jgi:glycosyltransferase involved in cell wall biosynthesis